MTIKDLKHGQWFTIKPIDNPTEKQVYIRGNYSPRDKKYEAGRFDDISYYRLFKPTQVVYTDFTF